MDVYCLESRGEENARKGKFSTLVIPLSLTKFVRKHLELNVELNHSNKTSFTTVD